MKRGFYSGLLAGFFGALALIVTIIVAHTAGLRGYWIIPEELTSEYLINYLIFAVGYEGIFGAIFGIIYSKFYKKIPGKGVVKGLIFGCMIGFLANLWTASGQFLIWLYTGKIWALEGGIVWAWGFVIWVVYGLMLGLIYERLKL